MEGRKGIVTSARREGNGTEYIVFDGESYHRVFTKKKIRGKSVVFTENDIEELRESVVEEVKRRFFKKISYREELPKDLESLRTEMEALWKELAFYKITGDRPRVYYDPDADGIVAYLLLSEAVKVNGQPLNPWNLETGNYLNPDPRAPAHILLDLGSSPDMFPGVKLLSSLAPTFIVDHHYTPERPPAHAVNPAIENPSGSRYFTAYLVSLLVKTWTEREAWVKVAAAGDRSDVLEWDKEDRKKALALELSTDVFGYNQQVWREILEGDLWKPLWELLEHRFERIDELSEKEEYEIGGRKVLHVRYPYPGFHYPHRGKVASWYQERGYDVVVVEEVASQKLFSVSLRGDADFLPLLRELEEKGLGYGWGHPNAVTVKTRQPDEAVGFILGWLEREGGKRSG